LDEPAESELYRLLLTRLPNAAIVSIGHRSSLIQFHDRFFELSPEASGRHSLAEAVMANASVRRRARASVNRT